MIYAEPGRYIWAVRPRDPGFRNMLEYGYYLTPSPTGLYRMPWWQLLMAIGASNLGNVGAPYAVVQQEILYYNGKME